MESLFGNAISAILSGGATGILGTGISLIAKFKLQKLIYEHEQKKMELETAQMRMEQETRMAIADREATSAESQSADRLMETSYAHDQARYATGEDARNSKWFIFLDFLRGIIRPGATIYLLGLTTALTYEVLRILNGLDKAISAEMAASMVQQSILVILYITSTVVLWWFGTRNKLNAPS